MYNVDDLKQRLVHVWHGIDQIIIDNAIDEWRGRLRACVRAKGGHFECDNKRFIFVNIIRFTKFISVIQLNLNFRFPKVVWQHK